MTDTLTDFALVAIGLLLGVAFALNFPGV